MAETARLPAEDRLEQGLRDLEHKRASASALWLALAERRLRSLGLPIPSTDWLPVDREIALYRLLEGRCDDPYYRYNSLKGELDSLISSIEARKARADET